MMDTWYDTLLISEYGITVLILGYGAFHGYFITWWLYMLQCIYVVYSSGYSFLNIVSAKLLSMSYILLNWVKSGFLKCFLNGELDERVDVRF